MKYLEGESGPFVRQDGVLVMMKDGKPHREVGVYGQPKPHYRIGHAMYNGDHYYVVFQKVIVAGKWWFSRKWEWVKNVKA